MTGLNGICVGELLVDAEQANATSRADTEPAITTLLDVLEVKQGV